MSDAEPSTFGLMFGAVLLATFLGLVTAVCFYIQPILFPTIWTYPWPENTKATQTKKDKQKIVLMAGSFNPPHLGHIEMIRYLSYRYGQVIVVVGHNPNKTYAVTPYQRADFLRQSLEQAGLKNTSVQTVAGYIWRYVPQAQLFFRGIRTWGKDGADERALQILNTWGPIVCGPFWMPRITYFLQGNPKYNHISSTLIREICASPSSGSLEKPTTQKGNGRSNELLTDLVPECIASQVHTLYSTTHHD